MKKAEEKKDNKKSMEAFMVLSLCNHINIDDNKTELNAGEFYIPVFLDYEKALQYAKGKGIVPIELEIDLLKMG